MLEIAQIHFKPGQPARAVIEDYQAGDFLKAAGFKPLKRASHVEMISCGVFSWHWFVDMSPLGDDYEYCLWPPFESRQQALAAEHKHIEETWLRDVAQPTT